MTYRELAEQWRNRQKTDGEHRVEAAETLENEGAEDSRVAVISGRFIKAQLRRTAETQTGRGRNVSK